MTPMTPMTPIGIRAEDLGGSPLARAAIAGETPPGWHEPRPRTPAEWKQRVEAVRAPFAGSGWLDTIWPAIEPHGTASDRLRRAADHGVIVTTGQQPGLFGGPSFTWFKALTALALANALEDACGVPVAPLLWAATDDTDFAEAATTWIARPGGAVPLTMPNARLREGMVMAVTPLGDLRPEIDQLAAAAGSASYPEALEAVQGHYSSPARGGTVGSAYVGLLRRLLEPLGVAVLDAAHQSVRARAFPLLRRALEKCDLIETALRERGREIEDAGYEPQVALVPGLSLVFEYDEISGTKRRVPLTLAADLSQRASPLRLMPNVLLRPIVERAALPTVAYTAGPGEIAYFAQVSAVAKTLDAAQPLAVPRWSGTIVEPEVARLLDQYRLTIDDLRDPHAAENRFARDALPPDVREALQALRESIDSGIGALREADEADLAPDTVPEGARRAMLHRLKRLERRYIAGVKRANEAAMRDIATLRGWLFPHGVRQERALNFIPILARHGPDAIDALSRRVDEHVATVLLGTTAAVGSVSATK